MTIEQARWILHNKCMGSSQYHVGILNIFAGIKVTNDRIKYAVEAGLADDLLCQTLNLDIGESSNGRTDAFEASNGGSIPSSPAKSSWYELWKQAGKDKKRDEWDTYNWG